MIFESNRGKFERRVKNGCRGPKTSTDLSGQKKDVSGLGRIKVEAIDAELEGDLDIRGFLGLSNTVRSGFQNVRVNFKVKTDTENIEKLKALSTLSPVFDMTAHGTKVQVNIERKGVLKKAASGVLAPWPCSRTPSYAPLVQAAAALLDGSF